MWSNKTLLGRVRTKLLVPWAAMLKDKGVRMTAHLPSCYCQSISFPHAGCCRDVAGSTGPTIVVTPLNQSLVLVSFSPTLHSATASKNRVYVHILANCPSRMTWGGGGRQGQRPASGTGPTLPTLPPTASGPGPLPLRPFGSRGSPHTPSLPPPGSRAWGAETCTTQPT